MQRPIFSVAFTALLTSSLALACSSTDQAGGKGADKDGGNGASGGGGGANSGGATGIGGSSTDGGNACSITLAPSSNDVETIQTALDTKVKTGNTVCFAPGTYKLQNHISLSKSAGITFRGTGATRDEVILDFTGQTAGEEGVLVTTDKFIVENLSIKNTAGNGIKVQATNSVFRNIKVSWDKPVSDDPDAGPLSGGYAIYPTSCTQTLIEDSEVFGAADAGIYTGQCKHVIARRNNSHGNVLGIEIENTLGAEIYDNDVHDNTCGFLLDLLPDLQQKDASDYLVHDNKVHDNNLPNFAVKKTLAAVMPQGTGILVLASRNVEITKNDIHGNDGVGVIVVSFDIIDILAQLDGGSPSAVDKDTSRWPTNIFIHDNVFKGNGTNPQAAYALLAPPSEAGTKTIPYDVLWDGIIGPKTTDPAAAKICLGTAEQASFVNFHADTSLLDPTGWTTDPTPNKCTLPAISTLTP